MAIGPGFAQLQAVDDAFPMRAHPVAEPAAIGLLGTDQLQGIAQFFIGALANRCTLCNHLGNSDRAFTRVGRES